MKRFAMMVAMAAAVAVWANVATAEDAAKDDAQQAAGKEVKTISGKSACATCDGVTEKGHNIMLVDKDGGRWVLIGSGEDYKKAHKVRTEGKKMTASYKEAPKSKKDSDGKEYKEVQITKIQVEGEEA
jgi:hypothetical protein